ncbi:hypothetical protein G9F71_003465 [Clostridium sp. FP2]|nr:hypothetical protein [Clostridium sp. FP2]MBZ9621914.1 hypothetical protein [Clostridium sp. FP2]
MNKEVKTLYFEGAGMDYTSKLNDGLGFVDVQNQIIENYSKLNEKEVF